MAEVVSSPWLILRTSRRNFENLLAHTIESLTDEGTSLVAQRVKNLPAMQETQVRSLGWEDPLEEGMSQENPHGRGAWWATVYGVTKSRTQLSN